MKISLLLSLFVLSLFKTSSEDIQTVNVKYTEQLNFRQLSLTQSELHCLTENILFEAGNQSIRGKIAVGQITLNRVNSKKFGSNICKTVYQPHQFSWTLQRKKPKYDKIQYIEAKKIAEDVMFKGKTIPELKDAFYYHANYVKPIWRKKLIKVAQIESHIFYKQRV